jgi:hypothetical protein
MATGWYYRKHGEAHGPVRPNELKRLAESGQISPDDLVWKEGLTKWIRAVRVKGLFPAQTREATAGTREEPLPLPPPEPAAPTQEQVLLLYDLLRDEPVFVDWYLKTYRSDWIRWGRSELPRGALWSRWGVTIAVSWAVALTGVGLLITIPTNIYLLWRFEGDRVRYREWRRRVDALVKLLGFRDALALMERAPKVQGFNQFVQYATSLGGFGTNSTGNSSAEQDDG